MINIIIKHFFRLVLIVRLSLILTVIMIFVIYKFIIKLAFIVKLQSIIKGLHKHTIVIKLAICLKEGLIRLSNFNYLMFFKLKFTIKHY